MLRNIGVKVFNLKRLISEIYKSNARFLADIMEVTRKKEILQCKKEREILIQTYENILSEASKMALDNVYIELEKAIIKLIPSFKQDDEFMMSLIRHEISLIEDADLRMIQISTGSYDFFYTYSEVFNVKFDEGLGEDLLLIRYKDEIKSVDFSNMSENLIKDIKLCRKKHLSMIDAMKMNL